MVANRALLGLVPRNWSWEQSEGLDGVVVVCVGGMPALPANGGVNVVGGGIEVRAR